MSNLISEIRRKFKISQVQMSTETGLNREFINKMENGKVEISEKTIGLLNQIYKLDGIKPHIDNDSGFLNDQNTLNDTDKKEKKIDLTEVSVHSIIDTNRNISRTLEKMVDTNSKFASLLESIIPAKKETHLGLDQDVLSKMSQILEFLVEVGSGKRWETKEDGILELNTRFYGNSKVSQETDTLIGKDK